MRVAAVRVQPLARRVRRALAEQEDDQVGDLAVGGHAVAQRDAARDVAQRLPELKAEELAGLNVVTDLSDITNPEGIF